LWPNPTTPAPQRQVRQRIFYASKVAVSDASGQNSLSPCIGPTLFQSVDRVASSRRPRGPAHRDFKLSRPMNAPTKQGPTQPPQAIAIDEDSATQHTSIIDTRLPLALGKERRQPLDLRGQSAV